MMMTARSRKLSAKGQGVLESLITIFTAGTMLLAMSSLGVYIYVEHAMVSAARDGARLAALSNELLNGTAAAQTAAMDDVKDYVIDYAANTAGQTLTYANIEVIPPDPADPFGQRTATVRINYDLQNMWQPASGNGGDFGEEGHEHLTTLPVVAVASMRYEE